MQSFSIQNIDEVIKEVQNPQLMRWRSYDGTGNNMYNPLWGSVNQNLLRISQPSYNTSSATGVAIRGIKNPSPRLVSNELCKGENGTSNLTDMTWIWGQFLAHEIDITHEDENELLNMSTQDTGPNEDFSDPIRTITFKRSSHSIVDGVREHANGISSFIDASNVYGSSIERVYEIRRLDGSGKLKTTLSDNGEEILHYNTNGLPNAMSTDSDFFLAGDVRANENAALLGLHTLFVREHNRLCDMILEKEPVLKNQDEQIFQKARKLIIGMMQNITFSEFLPHLVGNCLSEYKGYDSNINPGISTEFSTVGYRIGHSMVTSEMQVGENSNNTIKLLDVFFKPSYVQQNGVNDILEGAVYKKMQNINRFMNETLRSFLFGEPTDSKLLDLSSLNIQRGRDHGIPGYNTLRVSYGLDSISSFDDLPMDSDVIGKMSELYDSPDDIDPWVGMLCEEHVSGAEVGPLCKEIIVEQFERLRTGDYFWFECDSSLSDEEICIIRKSSLSEILSRNTDRNFPSNAFKSS